MLCLKDTLKQARYFKIGIQVHIFIFSKPMDLKMPLTPVRNKENSLKLLGVCSGDTYETRQDTSKEAR